MIYVGIGLLIVSIIGYVISGRINSTNTSRLKKAEKAVLHKKSKTISYISHAILAVAIIITGFSIIQLTSGKYAISKLDYKAEIQVTTDKDYGDEHSDSPVNYEMKIPTSGTHSPHDLKFGFYKERPPLEKLVHNLEHGDIIIHYHPNASAATLETIEYLTNFRAAGAGVLAVPNSDITTDEIVATAWRKTMNLPAFDEEKMGTFIYQNINRGPEAIPSEIRRGGGTM